MPKDRNSDIDYRGPVRRVLVAILAVLLGLTFLAWRIDSPRVERVRNAFVDMVVPNMDWAMGPATKIAGMIDAFHSYTRIYEQNQELRRELQQMKAWKEAAVQLEQQNAKLLAQNQVKLDPKLTAVSGVVLADSGSPFRQSVILNVGSRDGVVDGWAAMDGLGLVGRISGVGENTARLLLLTDASSRIPVTIQPSGQKAMLVGDNGAVPPLEFIETPEQVKPDDRVISSGDGGVFPAGLLVGTVVQTKDKRYRVRLAADYDRLEFVRVLRAYESERIEDSGGLILPETPPAIPDETNRFPPQPEPGGDSNG
ncbi:MAG: rod shape-determining protein MreC [Paracoccaceae bacterium]